MYDVTPTPPPSESSSQSSSPSHSSRSESFISQDMSSHSSQNESYHTSQDGSLHSSDFESSHSTTPPHLSNQSSAGSLPNSSSSPVRALAPRLPPNLPVHAELKPTWSFMPTARPIYSHRSNFITHMHGGIIIYRPPVPSAPPMETSQPPRTPEVSAKGIISPSRSITSSLSSLSPLSLTPPLSPAHAPPSTSLPASLPAKPLPLTSASLSRLSSGPTHCKSLPLLNETSSFPPTFSSDSQATMLPAYESLKKSVSEPNFEN